MNRLFLNIAHLPLMLGMLLIGIFLVGCSDGSDGTSSGTITGLVTNGTDSGAPLVGALVTPVPTPGGATYATDANGRYTASLPIGNYTLTYSADGFESQEASVGLVAATTETVDVELEPVTPVIVAVSGAPPSAAPGGVFALTAEITTLDGSTVQSYLWTQTNSATAMIANETTATVSVTLGDVAAYKEALLHEVDVQSRWGVVGIDPFALEEGGVVTFQCEVTTSSGVYTAEVDVHTDLGFASRSTGLRNVPINVPVLLGSKVQASYAWALTPPAESSATLGDAATANPWFVPDVAGMYTLTVFDIDEGADAHITIYAASWVGGIDGQDEDGRPTMACLECHEFIFPDKFEDWAASGHAEIFTNNVNTGGHYGPGCFDCHGVGYHPGAANGGLHDTAGYDDFLAAMFPEGQSHPDPNNWATILDQFPEQAQMANVQCEQCHGPNGTGGAHIQGHAMDGARVSADAQVCATCHGEPPRHARFQQWQESGHGNFEVALDEGTNGSCAKCHTAQGFLEWFANDLDVAYSTSAVDEGLIQPITCVVCHDPHNVGTRSGDDNDVTMRVDGDSPLLLGGFTAYGLGNGAMCIVCHNTRRGLANDDAGFPEPDDLDRAPHGGAQGDVLMGQNAYFVDVGLRGGHSYITNSCSACHMQITDPPADLSYNLSGTNHTFAADTGICSECHGLFDGDSLIATNEAALAQLADSIAEAIEKEILFHTGAPNSDTVTCSGAVSGVDTDLDITAATVIGSVELTEYRGRAAMNIELDGTLLEQVQLGEGTTLLSAGAENLVDNTVVNNHGDTLAKCCWNYFLLHNDGSHGIHNPSFLNTIVVKTTSEIQMTWP